MKLPQSIQVGSMRYAVLPMPREMHELAGAIGLCDKTQLAIHIWMEQAEPKLWSCLLHEVIHAMFEESPIDCKDEEDIVGALERIQCAVFKDNPTFIKNLIKVLRDQGDT